MILDNILRTLNKYMADIFDMFGGESKEYMNAMKQVKEALPESVLEDTVKEGLDYKGASPTEPVKFARGKAAQAELENFKEDLRQLRELQKETGTARRQAKKYIEDAEARGLEADDIDIREEARHLYEFDNSTNDWYDEIMEDEDIPDDWKEEIRDKYSDLNEDYEDANFRDELEVMVRVAQRYSKSKKKRRQLEEPSADEPVSDVGYKIEDDFGGIDI